MLSSMLFSSRSLHVACRGRLRTGHGVQVQHAGRGSPRRPGGARVADDQQGPMQVVVDGHEQEVPGEDVHALRACRQGFLPCHSTAGGCCSINATMLCHALLL